MDTPGTDMFARYTYAPNRLGYCGPAEAAALRNGSSAEIRAVAARFSGVWPYLRVMSRLTGIDDPLDHRLVESYWLGGGVAAHLDSDEFMFELLAVIGPVAGSYWTHLRPELAAEAAANHCFHVFGVYPWSRLLGRGMDEHPVSVLDNCRINWGTVVSHDETGVALRCRSLAWNGQLLELSTPSIQRADVWADGYSALPDVAVGDEVAVHWGRLCGRLSQGQVQDLEVSTARQLEATNLRLAASVRREP
ncbi:DUF6390 family protein [Nocardia sp. NBC_00565]|uniref:DUF6390 family protein n=1 Tax=Nocardia sp. NBC_00565 TaxID=2975993 RepID=UPI002E8212E6|nr:DUF6390 family protein [Nocardia sp. NBC_00565]WUC06470.1 DUF6390 family protein [Nocardia sp. NBC_00565]